MRTRAGIVLIENNRVALIERHSSGVEYYVFTGGGVEEGENQEEAAAREATEELGLEVIIKQKVAIIHFGDSKQIYFLAERVSGEFGTGTGEEFTGADPNSLLKGTYIPIWMTIADLSTQDKVFPADLAQLVVRAQTDGWPKEPVTVIEKSS
jgi:8-oxo-dGTP pyrophosphatase MutT (NUDIX family)